MWVGLSGLSQTWKCRDPTSEEQVQFQALGLLIHSCRMKGKSGSDTTCGNLQGCQLQFNLFCFCLDVSFYYCFIPRSGWNFILWLVIWGGVWKRGRLNDDTPGEHLEQIWRGSCNLLAFWELHPLNPLRCPSPANASLSPGASRFYDNRTTSSTRNIVLLLSKLFLMFWNISKFMFQAWRAVASEVIISQVFKSPPRELLRCSASSGRFQVFSSSWFPQDPHCFVEGIRNFDNFHCLLVNTLKLQPRSAHWLPILKKKGKS